MTLRQRKLLGTLAIIAFLIVYCLVAMAIGGIVFVGSGVVIETAYFVIAGIAWLPVVMALIRWMSKA
jgi:hypothetical protein